MKRRPENTGLMLYKDKTDLDGSTLVTTEEANTYRAHRYMSEGDYNWQGFSCKGCLNYNLRREWEVDESFICLADELVGVCMTCGEEASQGEY